MDAPKVLIVSASTGTGHLRAASALTECFRRKAPEIETTHVDLLELAPRWVRAAYGNGYEFVATKTPRIWGQLYHRTDTSAPELARWGPTVQRVLFREFRRLLSSHPWVTCLCTHFLPGQLAAGIPGMPPFVMVITDLTLHRFWAQPRVQRYFVANEALAGALRPRVGPAQIDVTGIPIGAQFGEAPATSCARASLGLEIDRPTVLVMGGGLGLGVEQAARAAMASGVEGLQVVVLCGRNEAARARLLNAGTPGCTVQSVGFVTDVERYIAAADIVVTKPGGLSCSEVTAIGRPLLFTNAIPGQEEGNARFVCEAGAALPAVDGDDITVRLRRAFAEPGLLLCLSKASRALGRPRAADQIVGEIRQHAHTWAAA